MKSIIQLAVYLLAPLLVLADEGFVIRGKVTGIVSGYVSVDPHRHEGEASEEVWPERVRIVNGEFVFKGKVDHPELVRLKISTRTVDLLLENAEYTVAGDFQSLNGRAFKGGLMNEQFWAFIMSGKPFMEYIEANPYNEVAPFLAHKYAERREEAEKAYGLLSLSGRGSWHGQLLAERIANYKKTAAGKPVPDFIMTDPSGRKFSMASLKGATVVLDFWASWCAPCRAYIPKMRELYNKYRDRNVVFVAVSFDEKDDEWRKAMSELNMEWMQGLVDGGFKDGSPVKKLFGITSIPHVVVVGPDGNVAESLDFYNKERLPGILEKLAG